MFDPEWYAAQNPDVIRAGYDPLEHYLQDGLAEGRFPSQSARQQAALAQLGSEAFDSDWYAAHNPDVVEPGLIRFSTISNTDAVRDDRRGRIGTSSTTASDRSRFSVLVFCR